MSNEKKYIIIWHSKDGSGHTFYTGLGTRQFDISGWSGNFDKATTFSLSDAREIIAKIRAFYNSPDTSRAKIHEYIPAHFSEAVKSDKEMVIEKLQHAVRCTDNVIEDMERVDTVFGDIYTVSKYLAEAIKILKNMK